MMKIDEILSRLQEQQPDVCNPDELTDSIMDSLPDMDDVEQNECHDQTDSSKKHARRIRLYAASAIAAAASVMLLISLGIVSNNHNDEGNNLVAQTDTAQTIIKNVEKQPLQKGKDTEMAESVKVKKERYRMPRPPKHYIAKAETAESTPEPELMDTSELAERAFAEEMRLMRMMVQMQGNLQADFKGLTDEIRSRGECMSQHVEMALNEDEW